MIWSWRLSMKLTDECLPDCRSEHVGMCEQLRESNLNGGWSISRNWQSHAVLSWARRVSSDQSLTIKSKLIKAWQQEPEVQLISVVHATEIHGTTKPCQAKSVKQRSVQRSSKEAVCFSRQTPVPINWCSIEWPVIDCPLIYLVVDTNVIWLNSSKAITKVLSFFFYSLSWYNYTFVLYNFLSLIAQQDRFVLAVTWRLIYAQCWIQMEPFVHTLCPYFFMFSESLRIQIWIH